MQKELYKVHIKNEHADQGESYSSSGRTIRFSPTLELGEGYNPGELLAFSWSTCLEATLRYVLSLRSLEIKSYTEVTFTMTYDLREPKGYVFLYDAKLYLDMSDQSLIDSCVNETHQRCPISKILNSEYIQIQGFPIKK